MSQSSAAAVPAANTATAASAALLPVELLADLQALHSLNPAAYDSALRQLHSGNASVVMDIPTHLVVRGRYANRSLDSFKTQEYLELKSSIERSRGNTVPIAVRPLKSAPASSFGTDEPAYEIVFGHRRFQACRELGLPVRAILLKQVNDRELTLRMFMENESRASLSPWEAGQMYKMWLDEGLYSSQNEIARTIGRSSADISRALRITKLPDAILGAFESPLQLHYLDADCIERLLASNESAVLEAAEGISLLGEKLSRTEVLKRLALAAHDGGGVGSSNTPRKRALKAGDRKLGSVAWNVQGEGLIRVMPGLSPEAQQKIEESIEKLLAREVAAAAKPAAAAKAASAK